MSKVQLLLDVVEDLRSLADSIKAVASAVGKNEAPEEAPPKKEEATAPQEKPITQEQVRAVLSEKSQDGKTDKVRALLLKSGAPKLSGIDPKSYQALLQDAEVL